jgi:hypothetical protein
MFTRKFLIAVEMKIVELELIVRHLWRRLLIITLIGFLLGVLAALTYTLP